LAFASARSDPVDAGLFDALMTIELSQHLARPVARSHALAVMAAYNAARAGRPLPPPGPMSSEEHCRLITQLVALVG
jgi:hypothetical protein